MTDMPRQTTISDDGFGRMQHCARGQMPFHTGYRPQGYYWQHVNGPQTGAFKTRALAEQAERALPRPRPESKGRT